MPVDVRASMDAMRVPTRCRPPKLLNGWSLLSCGERRDHAWRGAPAGSSCCWAAATLTSSGRWRQAALVSDSTGENDLHRRKSATARALEADAVGPRLRHDAWAGAVIVARRMEQQGMGEDHVASGRTRLDDRVEHTRQAGYLSRQVSGLNSSGADSGEDLSDSAVRTLGQHGATAAWFDVGEQEEIQDRLLGRGQVMSEIALHMPVIAAGRVWKSRKTDGPPPHLGMGLPATHARQLVHSGSEAWRHGVHPGRSGVRLLQPDGGLRPCLRIAEIAVTLHGQGVKHRL